MLYALKRFTIHSSLFKRKCCFVGVIIGLITTAVCLFVCAVGLAISFVSVFFRLLMEATVLVQSTTDASHMREEE